MFHKKDDVYTPLLALRSAAAITVNFEILVINNTSSVCQFLTFVQLKLVLLTAHRCILSDITVFTVASVCCSEIPISDW